MKDTGCRNKGTNGSSKRAGLGCSASESMKATSQKRKTIGKNKLGLNAQAPPVQPSPSEIEQASFGPMIPKDPKHAVKISEQSCKLKLQLFPVNEYTKKILEEDKFNPYLELTLTTRKKISSVVKHLNVKWGSSKAALGELMLVPYDACLENIARPRIWTSKDCDTTTADVYAFLGNPAQFRLRYGWSSNPVAMSCLVPIVSNESEYSLKPNFKQFDAENHQQFFVSNIGKEPLLFNRSCVNGADTYLPSDNSVQNKDDSNVNKDAKLSWVDCVSNMSFGALLSEVSQASNPNLSQSLHAQRISDIQQMPFPCDSFDAAIAALVAQHEPARQTIEAPLSSIWEAEQACHAFPSKITTASSQKNSVSSEEALSSWKKSSTTILENSLVPKETELMNVASHALCANMELQEKSNDDIITVDNVQPCTQNNVDGDVKEGSQSEANHLQHTGSQLGGVNISCPESLGPWDIASCSRGMAGNDTVGLAGLISSSMDAFQNFSIF